MKQEYSLVIIGAGPAGMSAAIVAAQCGLDVLVLDEQKRCGGQIYRGLENSPWKNKDILGKDYYAGETLISDFLKANIEYQYGASVWNIESEKIISFVIEDKSHTVTANQIIIAAGAQERPMPIQGWELPGVMTAGAGQILLKSSAMIPSGNVVLAGSGPLLLLLACQYLEAGVSVKAILDTTPKSNTRRALPYWKNAMLGWRYIIKGLQLQQKIRRAKVPVIKYVSQIKAQGERQLQSVSYQSATNANQYQSKQLEAETLLLHHGVIPQLHLVQVAECEVGWHPQQQCWQAKTDSWGESSVEGIFVVGDNAAIIGAKAAEHQGALAAHKIAFRLGKINASQLTALTQPIKKKYNYHSHVRPFLDALFRLPNNLAISDDTIVCRCEEVTAKEIREIARLGCQGPNQAKSFSRCGMGPCQGRQCGLTVSALIAEEQNRPIHEVGYYRVRPPIKPITLGQLGGVTKNN